MLAYLKLTPQFVLNTVSQRRGCLTTDIKLWARPIQLNMTDILEFSDISAKGSLVVYEGRLPN